MRAASRERRQRERDLRALREVAAGLEAAGADVTLEAPGAAPIEVGRRPRAARVVFRTPESLAPLARRDHLALAEAYLAGAIDVQGDFSQVVRVTDVIAPDPGPGERLAFAARLLLRPRRALQRDSIAFHYDRPPEFFLPWLERWRSYAHGFYRSPGDPPEEAQARKLQYAVDALGVKPGERVFDMGCGWGAFLEYAGLRGIEVHGITISREQHRFVEALIRERSLPCRVELVDFLDYRPRQRFDGAVFMGTFEHFSDYDRAARFCAAHLAPGAKLYADFCTTRGTRQVGAFLAKHIWPGTATYVDLPKLLRALSRAGWNAHVLEDDTLSYAYTVRDWADRLERARDALAARFGEESVRAFTVFLRASQHFLETNRTQAYHLVAGREPAPLERLR